MIHQTSRSNIFVHCCIAMITGFIFSWVSFASSQEKSEETNNHFILFSGYTWQVKDSGSNKWGPGSNLWSSRKDNVWVGRDGKLHLKITNKDGVWYCAEVVNTQTLGYGTYRFYIEGRPDQMDPNVVLGLFTYDERSNDASAKHHREIDIEFIKYGNPKAANLAYTVQPYTKKQNMLVKNAKLYGTYSTHSFIWTPQRVDFLSLHGHRTTASKGLVINKWSYQENDIPDSKNEKVDINLWLYEGKPPVNNKEVEIIISKFEFIPRF